MGTINVKDAAGDTVAVARILNTGQAAMAESLPVVLASNQPNVPVSGPLTDTQLRAAAVPVAMSSAPLPFGAATDATLAAVGAAVATVAGHVDGLEAATGTQADAASAADGSGNYGLIAAAKRSLLNQAALLGHVDGLEATAGAQADVAAGADGTGNYSLLAAAKRALLNWASLLSRLPAALVGGRFSVASSVPHMSTGVIMSAQTAATGTNWTAFASQACVALDIVNNTGTTIEYRRGAAGTAMQIPSGAARMVIGITNASAIDIRRTDTSNTQVTVQAEAFQH